MLTLFHAFGLTFYHTDQHVFADHWQEHMGVALADFDYGDLFRFAHHRLARFARLQEALRFPNVPTV